MTDVLTTRDGLIGNSPRYTGHTSPPYQRYLKDDAGNAINLTGVSPSAFGIVFVNQSNPLWVKAGSGTFNVPSGTASQGLASYQYGSADLADAGNWYAFWTVQLSGEPTPRAFDPDFLSIIASPTVGGSPSVTIQDVNLTEVNGTAVSSSNPVPTSGPITAVDGGIATIGTTTDTSSANTTIGLLKAIKAYLGGTLTASVNSLPALPAGTNVIGHVIVDSAGAVTITTLPSIPAGTNVIGHVIVDSAGSVSITSLPSLPAGSNTIGGVKIIDSAGTNVAGVDSSNNQLVKVNAALPAGTNVIGHVVVDSAGSVSVTSLPSIPAGTNVIGHVVVDSASSVSVSSLPALVAGSANIGGVEIYDSAGTNKLAVNASGQITESNSSSIATNTNTTATNTANIPAKGQATMANSTPVVIASNQGNIPIQLVDSGGTNKAAIDSAGNQVIKGNFTEQASLSAGSLNADLVASTDVSAYKWLSLHLTGNAYSGTLSFQCSNDNVNWNNNVGLIQTAGVSNPNNSTTATNALFHGPVYFRYLRIRMTAYTSGSATGVLELYTSPLSFQALAVIAAQSGTWTAVPNAATSGGSTPYHLISASGTNATSLKASAGQLYNYTLSNTNAAARFVKFYNKASSPVVGTDTPVKTVQVPANSTVHGGFTVGSVFGTGIAFATTTGVADSDTGSVGASDLSIDLEYK